MSALRNDKNGVLPTLRNRKGGGRKLPPVRSEDLLDKMPAMRLRTYLVNGTKTAAVP
jgi:hypothetical protein